MLNLYNGYLGICIRAPTSGDAGLKYCYTKLNCMGCKDGATLLMGIGTLKIARAGLY